MLERVLRTLLHPRLAASSLAVLQLYAGGLTLLYPSGTLRAQGWWAALGFAAGVCGLVSVWRPSRFLVSAAGSLIVMACAARGMAILDRVVFVDSNAQVLRSTAAIGTAQWFTMAYMSFVVWRRLVVPWSVLQVTDRRAVPRD